MRYVAPVLAFLLGSSVLAQDPTPTCRSYGEPVAIQSYSTDREPAQILLIWTALPFADVESYSVYRGHAAAVEMGQPAAGRVGAMLGSIAALCLVATILSRRKRGFWAICLVACSGVTAYFGLRTGMATEPAPMGFELINSRPGNRITQYIDTQVSFGNAYLYFIRIALKCPGVYYDSETARVVMALLPTPTPTPTLDPSVPTRTPTRTETLTPTFDPSTPTPTRTSAPTSTPNTCACCADPGACSGHGGVNCAAGPDSDGSVICTDGWRDSAVVYRCRPC